MGDDWHAAGAALGAVLDWRGFLGNPLAELIGLIIGIVVALLLVERLNAARRRERWMKVRTQTYTSIYAHISDTARESLLYTPLQRLTDDAGVIWLKLYDAV